MIGSTEQEERNRQELTQRVSDELSVKGKFFALEFENMASITHTIALSKGWWDGGDRNFGEVVALMHSELSEALEAHREDAKKPSSKIEGFTEIEEEFADVIIRIMDYAKYNNLNVGGAVVAKSMHNVNRPYKHGKKY